MESDFDYETIAEAALIPPALNTTPLPKYAYDKLDYGMTIGVESTRRGRLWACWVAGGDTELAFFVLATSDDEGATWSAPRLVIDPHDRSLPVARRTIVGNLWLDPAGRLWLFFDQSMTYFDGRAGTWFTRCDNPDAESPSWSPPVRIWHGCVLNKPLVLSSGEWLLPVSLWDRQKIMTPDPWIPPSEWPRNPFSDAFRDLDGFRMANVLISKDAGETWTHQGGVFIPAPDFNEHHLIERRDGSLWLTARSGHGGIWESISTDKGATWSPASPTGIAHVSSRHFMRRLASGSLLLVKHGTTINTRPEGRSHLTAFLSEDDGITWLGGIVLDERSTISYPDGAQLPNGTLFITYDRNRDSDGEILGARFTEEEVRTGGCSSSLSALRIPIFHANALLVASRHKARERGNTAKN